MYSMTRRLFVSLATGAALSIAATMAYAEPSGTFKYAEQVKLITMDPQQQSGSGVPYLRPVYESLFERDANGKPAPLLATGYEIDGLNVKITLREGVKFSNGEAFNAEVAAANINRGVKLAIIEGPEDRRRRGGQRRIYLHDQAQGEGPGHHRQPDPYGRHDAGTRGNGRSDDRPQSHRHRPIRPQQGSVA
ncbi:MAG: hypothetical protein H6893_13260 [Brucellaceae bacterium]|nr:hypothetical protein [Brucellaceae bacterium]